MARAVPNFRSHLMRPSIGVGIVRLTPARPRESPPKRAPPPVLPRLPSRLRGASALRKERLGVDARARTGRASVPLDGLEEQRGDVEVRHLLTVRGRG
jgi:hypothetical protein